MKKNTKKGSQNAYDKGKKNLKSLYKKIKKNNRIFIPLFCIVLAAWVLAVTLITQYLIAYPMFWIIGDDITSPVWTTIYMAIVYLVSGILIILIPWKIFKRLKTNREELGLLEMPTWTDIGLAPIAFVAATILAYVFTSIFSIFPWFDVNQAQNVGFNTLHLGLDRAVAFIALVVIAPIAEEIIFRGWLYGKLRAKLAAPMAIFIVSLTFGLAHGQWNVGVNVFAMSIILCLLRETTGTVYCGIIMHMIKNGLAFYLLYILGV